MAFLRLRPIEHDLCPYFAELRSIPSRRALEKSALWRRIGPDIERVTSAIERGDHEACEEAGGREAPDEPCAAAGRRVRLAAWNIQRGARFDELVAALRGDPVLAAADVILLTEIDCGLGRSANRNVARELALALGMNYVFGPSYLTLQDDWGENRAGVANTTALAGTAILTRVPVLRAENVELPALRDKFVSSERRLGKKRALLVEVRLPTGPLLVAACHLDSNASPRQRAHQIHALLDRMKGSAPAPAIIGGDFNSSTHDLSSPLAMVRDAIRKIVVRGLRKTIDAYMRPEEVEERPIFQLLAAHGFALDGFNDRARATYRYDFNDPYALEKVRCAGGAALVWLVRRLSRPWNACLSARLDWFAGRGLRALAATVVDPRDTQGRAVSDHAAVVCDVEV